MSNDQNLQCIDCGTKFVWTVGEQDFFKTKELRSPRRCKPCRIKKRHRFGEQ